MFCTQCGTKVADADKFCASCGAPLSSGTDEPSQPPVQEPEPNKIGAKMGHLQSKASATLQVAGPSASVAGRKVLKWGLRVIGLFFAMILYLVWKEASMKAGMEGAAMGAARGIIVFGYYLAFVEWTRSLDATRFEGTNDRPTSRITGEKLAKYFGIGVLIAAFAYKSAPFNESPAGVWWVSMIMIAVAVILMWHENKKT